MRSCTNHPDRETAYVCLKHDVYMCEACLECRDPDIYCKYRSSCAIHFLTKRKGDLDGDDKPSGHRKDCLRFASCAENSDIQLMQIISYRPIGIIRSPFTSPRGTPIQPTGAVGRKGSVELDSAYRGALSDLDGFSHIYLIYHFHLAKRFADKVTPFLDDQDRGLFATRASARPNAIGLSVVRLERIKGTTLFVIDIDVVDGTPLLDIKPYVPAFDHREAVQIGWMTGKSAGVLDASDDGRFAER